MEKQNRPMPPSKPAEWRSARRPASGAAMQIANGHGVMRKPVSTALKCSSFWNRKGSDTNASICATKDEIEVVTDSAKIGIFRRSTGRSGAASANWRRTRTIPSPIVATISARNSGKPSPCPSASMLPISRPNVAALKSALTMSKPCGDGLVWGREDQPTTTAATPDGHVTANSHGQLATARIVPAIVGPIAEATATTSALMPMPRPSSGCG